MNHGYLHRIISLLLFISGLIYLLSSVSFTEFLLREAVEQNLSNLETLIGVLFSAAPAILLLGLFSIFASYRTWTAGKEEGFLASAASVLGIVGALHFAPLSETSLLLIIVNLSSLILLLLVRFT